MVDKIRGKREEREVYRRREAIAANRKYDDNRFCRRE